MNVIFYKCLDSDNVMNKTLNEVYVMNNVILNKNFNDINPVLVLNSKNIYDFSSVNYVEIVELNKFYFIRNVVCKVGTLFNIFLEIDVLETYKKEIINSKSHITRAIKENDFSLIDNKTQTIKEVDIYSSSKEVEIKNNQYIISTIGGV